MKKYVVLKETSPSRLEERVETYLGLGFSLVGGVCAYMDSFTGASFYIQAVAK